MTDKITGVLQAKVWRNPVNGKIFQGEMDVRYAQFVDVTNIQAIKAQVVLEEVLGLAR